MNLLAGTLFLVGVLSNDRRTVKEGRRIQNTWIIQIIVSTNHAPLWSLLNIVVKADLCAACAPQIRTCLR